jgi:hypothetical protein
MTDTEISRWWYLDLAAEFPELEIYSGHGWGPEQELGDTELGDRVMTEEALWLPTWFYASDRDRHWAAVSRLLAMVVDRIRRDRPAAERILAVLAGEDPEAVRWEEVPAVWQPEILRTELSRQARP